MSAVVTIGFVKDAKNHVDVQGFNVYHKNRLIKVSVSFKFMFPLFLSVFPMLCLQISRKENQLYAFVYYRSTCFVSHFGGYGMQQVVMVVES